MEKRKLPENEQITREHFSRIYLLACDGDSSLPITDNTILNYTLGNLSRANTAEPETVRSARFNDGLFLSFRFSDEEALAMQYDLTYYDAMFDRGMPRIVPYRVINYKNRFVRSEYSRNPFETRSLDDNEMRELAVRALALLSTEANSTTPWIHAYTPLELQQARERRGVKTARIAINPELGEPYL